MNKILSFAITALCMFLFASRNYAQEQSSLASTQPLPCDSLSVSYFAPFDANVTLPSYNDDSLHSLLQWPQQDFCGEGTVHVEVFIDTVGAVRCAIIRDSAHELFNANALKAIEQTPFTPGEYLGKPTSMWLIVPIRFALR